MEISQQRQKIHKLNRERSRLLNQAMRKRFMIKGSLYQMSRECGNPNCKCNQGSKHVSWYLSEGYKGGTKLTYIGRTVPVRIENGVKYYREQQKVLAEIRILDRTISNLLNNLRRTGTQSISQIKKEKKK